jgi:hypothetical protein
MFLMIRVGAMTLTRRIALKRRALNQKRPDGGWGPFFPSVPHLIDGLDGVESRIDSLESLPYPVDMDDHAAAQVAPVLGKCGLREFLTTDYDTGILEEPVEDSELRNREDDRRSMQRTA